MANSRGYITSNGVNSDGTCMNVGNKIWDPAQGGRPSVHLYPEYSSGATMKMLLQDESDCASTTPGNSPSMSRMSSKSSLATSQVQSRDSGTSSDDKEKDGHEHEHVADEAVCDSASASSNEQAASHLAEPSCDLMGTAPERLEDYFPSRHGAPQQSAQTATAQLRSSGGGNLATRQMYDKRELRRMSRDKFTKAIQDWQAQYTEPKAAHSASSSACQVFVRVRPLFDKESRQGEFEVVTANGEWGEVIVHNCLFHSDLVRMHIRNTGYCFPSVFAPDVQNDVVYTECGSPLIAHAVGGDLATLFMLGQTGSGKTYTMRGIIEPAVSDLFTSLHSVNDVQTSVVNLRAFEIAGKHCLDLLSSPNSHAELTLRADDAGHTQIVGATVLSFSSAEELLLAIWEALSSRKTTAHGRNTESSRSHCALTIELPTGGSLVLVDCAGTERRQDTEEHTAEQRREAAEINSSLHALKECIRFKHEEQRQRADGDGSNGNAADMQRQQTIRVPYRSSTLTRVLQDSFTRENAKLFAIGTLAPASIDTEHTLTTLQTLQLLHNASGGSDDAGYEEMIEVCSTGLKQRAAVFKPVKPVKPLEPQRARHRAWSTPIPARVKASTLPIKHPEPKSPCLVARCQWPAVDEKLSSTRLSRDLHDEGCAVQEQHNLRANNPFHVMVREQFRQLDINGDGALDIVELGRFLRAINADATAGEIQSQLEQIDKDCDGEVSFEEFLDFVHPIQNSGHTAHSSVSVCASRRSASPGTKPTHHLAGSSTEADQGSPPVRPARANQFRPAAGSALSFARQKASCEQMPARAKLANTARCTGGSKGWGRDCQHSFLR